MQEEDNNVFSILSIDKNEYITLHNGKLISNIAICSPNKINLKPKIRTETNEKQKKHIEEVNWEWNYSSISKTKQVIYLSEEREDDTNDEEEEYKFNDSKNNKAVNEFTEFIGPTNYQEA